MINVGLGIVIAAGTQRKSRPMPCLRHCCGALPAGLPGTKSGVPSWRCAPLPVPYRSLMKPPTYLSFHAVVSFVLFPVRARGLLQKKMASTLIKIGDLAVWIVGQVRLLLLVFPAALLQCYCVCHCCCRPGWAICVSVGHSQFSVTARCCLVYLWHQVVHSANKVPKLPHPFVFHTHFLHFGRCACCHSRVPTRIFRAPVTPIRPCERMHQWRTT